MSGLKHFSGWLPLCFLVCSLTLALPATAQANNPLELTSTQNEYPLGPYLEYLEDPTRALTVEVASSPALAARFLPNPSAVLNLGYSTSAYWLRLRLRNATPRTNWRLVLHDARVNQVDLYVFNLQTSDHLHKVTGRNYPFTSREVPNHEFVFELPLSTTHAITEQVIYLRVESLSALYLPFTLWTPEAFAQYSQNDYLVLGLGYGILLVMAGYNFFLFLALSDRTYLLYVLVVLSTSLTQASLDGLAHQYLWPGLANRYGVGPPVLLSVFAFIAFTSVFLNTAQTAPRLHRLIQADAVFGVIVAFMSFANLNWGNLWVLGSILLMGITSVVVWRRGYAPARFYVLASSILLLGVLVILFGNLRLLPPSFPIIKSVLAGYVLSALLWSFALADRIQLLKAQISQSHQALQASEKRLLQFLDAIPTGVVIHTHERQTFFLNLYARQLLFGETAPSPTDTAILQKPLPAVFKAGTSTPYPMEQLPLSLALQGQTVHVEDLEMETPHGRIPLSATSNPILNAQGQVSYVISAFEDITQRQQTAQLLQQTNAYLITLHDTTVSLVSGAYRTTEMLTSILQRAAELVGCENGFLHLLDTDANAMRVQVGIGLPRYTIGAAIALGEGLAGQVWASQETLVVSDYQTWPHRKATTILDGQGESVLARYRAMVGVPLKSGARVVGVIGLVHLEPSRQFTPLEVANLNRFAALASVVLDNARWHEQAQHELAERRQVEQTLRRAQAELEDRVQARTAELATVNTQLLSQIAERHRQAEMLRQQNEYLAALQETTLGLIHHLELFPLLEAIITRAASLVGSTHGQISLLEPGGTAMWQCVGIGIDSQFVGDRTRRGEGLTGRVWQTGQPLAVEDYRLWAGRKPGTNYDVFRASIGLPLTQNAGPNQVTVIGVLNVDYETPHIFQPNEQETLERFAQLASVALENAWLYQAATNEQSRLHALVQAIRDGLILVELDLTIRVINAPALKLLGLPHQPETWVGQSLAQMFGILRHTAPAALKAMLTELRQTQYGGEPLSEGNFATQRHKVHWLNTPVFKGLQPLARLLILQDQTEQQQLEKMREDLIHTMVHDLRNPLSAILLNLETVEDAPLTERQQRQIHRAKQGGERMLDLVNAILDISRLESGQMPLEYFPVDFASIFREVIAFQEVLAQQKNILVQCHIATPLPKVQADIGLLGRVLQNVVGNALKFTPAGGQVQISTTAGVNPKTQYPEVLITISDTGPGMTPAQQERLFQKFVTGQRGGSGLGLAFCKLAIEAHGGRIWAESIFGQGTTFKFTLPSSP